MGLLGGDARTLWAVDAGLFGASSLALWIVRRLSRSWGWHKSTRHIVTYAMLANMVRFVVGLLSLFSLFTTERSAGESFIFTRWLAYPLIYGLGGMTHALLEFLHQHKFQTRWVISIATFGFAALCGLGVNFAPDTDQQIVLLSLGGAFLLAGIIALFKSAKRRDVTAMVVAAIVSLGHIGYAIVLCLGPLVADRMSMLVNDGILLGLDLAHLWVVTALLILFHCTSESLHAPERASARADEQAVLNGGNQHVVYL